MDLPLFRRSMLVLVIATAIVVAGGFYWLSTQQPNIAFLPGHKNAEWILYPVPPDHLRHLDRELETVFKHSFPMTATPSNAQLSVRAFRKCVVEVNGTRVEAFGEGNNWKQATTADVSKFLRSGDNEIRVTVANAAGPPALWLSLAAGDFTLGTDSSWQVSLAGAVWQSAWPAAEPKEERPGNLAYGGERTLPALLSELPTILLLALLSGLLWAGARYAARSWPKLVAAEPSLRHVVLMLGLFWLLLFWNNHSFLQSGLGFDASNHITYIDYIQKNKKLPLANEAWEAYQPPLYYLISAVLLSVMGLPAKTFAAATVLRVLGCAVAVGQISFIFASLRLLFPAQPVKQTVGVLCAAFLSPHLYLPQYVSNELLSAMFGSAAIYLCLRILAEEHPSLRLHAALGAVLGAALLTKFSTVLLVPVIFVILLVRAINRKQPASQTFLPVGLVLLVCLLVCGWHYGRVWYHFGNPMIGNWDAVASEPWWQEPGFHTAQSYWGFGRAFVQPFRSGLRSVPDGFYSTLWGDGLYGGMGSNRPPWNHRLMAVGYLLAIVPSLAIIAGMIAVAVQLMRRPSAEWFFLLSLALLVVVALFYMTLKIPSYAQAKAFYGLFAVVPFVVFAVRGFDLVLRRWPKASLPAFLLLGTWALTSYLSLWVQGDTADARAWLGWCAVKDANLSAAQQHFREALRVDAHHVSAQVGLAATVANSGRTPEAPEARKARELFALAIHDHPDNGECYAASADWEPGEQAIPHLRKALQLAPDHPTASASLGQALYRQGQAREAIDAFREALRVSPYLSPVHTGLALALVQAGEVEDAVRQFRIALILQPDDASTLANLAWIRATTPVAKLRDGPDAVRLAEQACALSSEKDPSQLDVLAAAYAELGRFDEAEKRAREALDLAKAQGRTDRIPGIEKRLQLYQAKQPFRSE